MEDRRPERARRISPFSRPCRSAAPDIGTYRTGVQLIRLGHAACEDFGSGASYEQLADRLMLAEGSRPIPSEDLGAVIDAAVDAYCPQFTSRIG